MHTRIRHRKALCVAICLVAALLAPASPTLAALPDFGGSVGYGFHYLTDIREVAASGFDVDLWLSGDTAVRVSYRIQFKAEADCRPELQASLELGQAYIDAHIGNLDLRLGRQVVNWGTADGVNPTSIINPRSLMSFVGLNPASIPVPAILGACYLPGGSALTAVLITDFVPAPLPPEIVPVTPDGGPAGVLERLEFAARAETMFLGHNVYAAYFRGWDDYPAAWLSPTLPGSLPQPRARYRRVHQFGLATAGTVGGAAVWFEGAVTVPDHVDELETAPNLPMSSNDPACQVVVGVDYTFPRGTFASMQLVCTKAGSLLSPYSDPGTDPGPKTYAVVDVRFSLSDRHTAEFIGFADLAGRGVVLIPSCSVELVSAIRATLGAVSVFGEHG
ncbi:MAG: hypothetical protein NUW23_08060, partial [Firmicutes bacterium]|nr:hypothetical protein [Bacillota bacterium]